MYELLSVCSRSLPRCCCRNPASTSELGPLLGQSDRWATRREDEYVNYVETELADALDGRYSKPGQRTLSIDDAAATPPPPRRVPFGVRVRSARPSQSGNDSEGPPITCAFSFRGLQSPFGAAFSCSSPLSLPPTRRRLLAAFLGSAGEVASSRVVCLSLDTSCSLVHLAANWIRSTRCSQQLRSVASRPDSK